MFICEREGCFSRTMGSLASWKGASRRSALHQVKRVGNQGLSSYIKEKTLRLSQERLLFWLNTPQAPEASFRKIKKKERKKKRICHERTRACPHLPTRQVCPSPSWCPTWGTGGLQNVPEGRTYRFLRMDSSFAVSTVATGAFAPQRTSLQRGQQPC